MPKEARAAAGEGGGGVSESFLNGRVVLHCGDSRDVLKTIPDCSIDSIVTDPPYALVSIQKRFGKPGSAPVKVSDVNASNDLKAAYARASAGFMGKNWDTGETAFAVEFWQECLRVLKPGGHVVSFSGTRTFHRMVVAIEDAGFEIRDQIGWTFGSGFPKSHNAGNGWGTALKPAWEPICLARKPLSEKTVIANVAMHGTGAINVDGCRVALTDGDDPRLGGKGDWSSDKMAKNVYEGGYAGIRIGSSALGRFPANIIHDGSEEVTALFPDSKSGTGAIKRDTGSDTGGNTSTAYGKESRPAGTPMICHGDEGSAARFFYTSKADSDDRLGSKHPTVKPVDLMQWLCRLVTPKGGTVLDPFSGTGTTGEAAFREGFNAVLIEREAEYQADIRRRMGLILSGPDERARESIKARTAGQPIDAGPLFAEPAASSQQPAASSQKYASGRSKSKFFVALDPIAPSDQSG